MKKILLIILILMNVNVFATSFTMKELRFEQRKVVLSAFKRVHSVRKFQHKISQKQKHHKLKRVSKKSLFQQNMRQDLEDRFEGDENSEQEFYNKLEREQSRTLNDLRNLNIINLDVEDIEELRHYVEPEHTDVDIDIEVEIGVEIEIEIEVGMEDDAGIISEDKPPVNVENKPDLQPAIRKYSPWKRK